MDKLTCNTCEKEKETIEFNKSSCTKSGFQYKCRQCEKDYKLINKERYQIQHKIYNQNNKKKIKKQKQQYYLDNKEKIDNRNKRWEENNKEQVIIKRHEKYVRNKQNRLQQSKEWRINNLEKYREYQREWVKRKRREDVGYAIEHRLRNRMLDGLKSDGASKTDSYRNLVGCSRDELKEKMINLFTEGMTWQKFLDGEIEIDHIKPCCAFDLKIEEHQRECFHYSNLQPLWAKDNEAKIQEDMKRGIRKPTSI